MTTTTERKIISADNGYFEVHQRDCGHTIRVVTEYDQWSLQHGSPANRTALRKSIRDHAHATLCRKCAEVK